MDPRSVSVLGAIALVFSIVPDSSAMQMNLTRAELCSIATAVVVGEVTDIETRWAGGPNGSIERLAAVSMQATASGSVGGGDITVVLPGGEIGGAWHFVEDVPNLEVDGRYLLFLEFNEHRWYVIGGDAGAVRLSNEDDIRGEAPRSALQSLRGC